MDKEFKFSKEFVSFLYAVVIGIHLQFLFQVQKDGAIFTSGTKNITHLLFVLSFYGLFWVEWIHDYLFFKIDEIKPPLLKFLIQLVQVSSLSFAFIFSLSQNNLVLEKRPQLSTLLITPYPWFLVYLFFVIIWGWLHQNLNKKFNPLISNLFSFINVLVFSVFLTFIMLKINFGFEEKFLINFFFFYIIFNIALRIVAIIVKIEKRVSE